MTISIKPTASGSTIEQDGSPVLSIESDRSVDIDSGTLYVDATNNRVGIGTSSPTQNLHIDNPSGNVLVRLSSSDSDIAGIDLGDASDTDSARIRYHNSDDSLRFSVNGGQETLRIDSLRRFWFTGSTDADGALRIGRGGSGGGTILRFNKPASGATNAILNYYGTSYVGGVNYDNTSSSFITSSDYRLKENVVPMSGSIDRLKQLQPSTWTWTQDGSHGEGFLAHEAQTVVPEAVTGTKDEVDDEGNPVYQGIDQSKLVPLLTAALQEAITKIEDLETRIQALENPS